MLRPIAKRTGPRNDEEPIVERCEAALPIEFTGFETHPPTREALMKKNVRLVAAFVVALALPLQAYAQDGPPAPEKR